MIPIISVRDNENNGWKRNAKKTKRQQQQKNPKKDRKEQGGMETIAKGWELNDLVVLLS